MGYFRLGKDKRVPREVRKLDSRVRAHRRAIIRRKATVKIRRNPPLWIPLLSAILHFPLAEKSLYMLLSIPLKLA